MENKLFITITGTGFYYGEKPFEIGRTVWLRKDIDNDYDSEAIMVELPYIGKVGYVANSHKTVIKGTMSAGRLYDKIGTTALAKIKFVMGGYIVAEITEAEKLRKTWEDFCPDEETIKIEWNI